MSRHPYLATSYWVLGARPLSLRVELPAPELAAVAGPEMAGRVAFVTPCNPGGRALPTDQNAILMRSGLAMLAERGLKSLPGVGLADDGCWCEPSALAWPLAEDKARELAAGWGQLAWLQVGNDWVPRLFFTGL
ncbi:MAG: DUF3293 domain-containing protein, partial [Planctomycetota bacterium]